MKHSQKRIKPPMLLKSKYKRNIYVWDFEWEKRSAFLLNRKANRCIRSKSPHKIRILWITILLRSPLVGFITLRVCSSIFLFLQQPKMAFTRFVDFADISRLSISRSLLVFCLQLKANCQEYCQYFFALRQKRECRSKIIQLICNLPHFWC